VRVFFFDEEMTRVKAMHQDSKETLERRARLERKLKSKSDK
jgi:hypothetical protein